MNCTAECIARALSASWGRGAAVVLLAAASGPPLRHTLSADRLQAHIVYQAGPQGPETCVREYTFTRPLAGIPVPSWSPDSAPDRSSSNVSVPPARPLFPACAAARWTWPRAAAA